MNIAIIPARGGSQRIPLKNIKVFHGKPIIAYSIEKAKESGLFDRIIVSTDNSSIAAFAEYYGAEVHNRDPAYALDSVGTQEVVGNCFSHMCTDVNDTVCCIYATVPLMSVKDLRDGHALFNKSGVGIIDYVMSAGYPPLADAAQFYWGRAWEFVRNAPLISPRTRLIHVDPKRVCDINTPEDWRRALKMYEDLK